LKTRLQLRSSVSPPRGQTRGIQEERRLGLVDGAREQPGAWGAALIAWALLATAVLLALSRRFFQHALRSYRSASS
jgi:hypothetical protein